MHELGVVFHVIKTVEEIAAENNVKQVNSVTLELGEVSTVIPAYLNHVWRWAVDNRSEVLKGAQLKIETIHAETFCESCKQVYGTVEHGKICPYCGSGETYLVHGNEFNIKEIEACDETEE